MPWCIRQPFQPSYNSHLRRRIVELAQRHKRYGMGMIHLKLVRPQRMRIWPAANDPLSSACAPSLVAAVRRALDSCWSSGGSNWRNA